MQLNDKISIELLPVDAETKDCLKKMGIETINELLRIERYDRDILKNYIKYRQIDHLNAVIKLINLLIEKYEMEIDVFNRLTTYTLKHILEITAEKNNKISEL